MLLKTNESLRVSSFNNGPRLLSRLNFDNQKKPINVTIPTRRRHRCHLLVLIEVVVAGLAPESLGPAVRPPELILLTAVDLETNAEKYATLTTISEMDHFRIHSLTITCTCS